MNFLVCNLNLRPENSLNPDQLASSDLSVKIDD